MTRFPLLPACILLVLGLGVCAVSAQQDEASEPVEATQPAVLPPATQPAADEAQAEQAMQELLDTRQAAPVIQPQATQTDMSVEYPGNRAGAPAAPGDIDPAVLGVAPGQDPPSLRREGEFIVNRRGRLIRSSDGGYLLFVFEADTQKTPELPMVVQACQLLETMENTVEKRGDSTVFILTGQVNTYRGANYLLPTMMKIAFDKDNLTN
jgi:hypothetical protein